MEILQENYSKVITIEALTMVEMANKQIAPAVSSYCKSLSETAVNKKTLGIDATAELTVLRLLSKLNADFVTDVTKLSEILSESKDIHNAKDLSFYCAEKIIPSMKEIRTLADEMELHTAREYWPFPTYGDLMFNI